MTDREKLLRSLSEQQFAAWDAGLFLDTHPTCGEALKAQREYTAKYKELKKQYNDTYGMLTHSCPNGEAKWQWICDPWPWDVE